jgi:hypothetical protein
MAQIPAFCDDCGNIFISSNFIGGDVNVTLENVGISCPRCGSIAKVPNGVYQFIGDTIKILSAPYSSHLKLQKLADILQKVREKEVSAEEISKIIETELPEFSSIANYLKQQAPTVIIGVIQILLGLIQIHFANQQLKNPLPVTPQQVINQTFNFYQPNTSKGKKEIHKKSRTSQKVAVNSLCHCGSGRTYKKCHAAQER